MNPEQILAIKNALESSSREHVVIATTKVACSVVGQAIEVGGYRIFALPFSGMPNMTNKSIEVKTRPLYSSASQIGDQNSRKEFLKQGLERAFEGYNINFWMFPGKKIQHTGWKTACKGFCQLSVKNYSGCTFDLLVMIN